MGAELSRLAGFPVEFGAIPAIQSDNEIRPDNTGDDVELLRSKSVEVLFQGLL
jgi:hypothetical protein